LTRYYQQIIDLNDDEICICVLFDIDYFKKVNDTYGHVVGDQVLSILSKLVNEYFRKTDILIRYGGEEFILFVKNISYSTACTKVDNFRKYIESSNRFPQNIKITISAGVVVVDVDEELELLVDRVDKLLYQAKEGGRNRVVFQEFLK
jgi:diguanylate cyclase (GGDEF)-like protein